MCNAHKQYLKMYEIPIAFIPIYFTDVFETTLFSVSQIKQLSHYIVRTIR